MGMPHWEKNSLLSEIQEGKVVFFFISTSGFVHSVVAKIEIEWKLTSHPNGP